MRTDAKIGFAIGGVLLAVLTVYAIVVPKHSKKTTGTVSLVTPVPANPSTTDTWTTSSPPPIAAADSGTTPGTAITLPKDPATTPPTPPAGDKIVDNTGGMTDEMHAVLTPKVSPKVDTAPGKLDGDVYTPAGKERTRAHGGAITPLPDDTTVASTDRTYTIKPGQTLSKIAYEVYGNSRFWVAIQRENKGLDSNHLKVGSIIKLPDVSPVPGPVVVSDDEVAAPAARSHTETAASDGRTYTVKSGDSLYGIAKRLLGSGRKADLLYSLNKDVIGPDKSRLKLGMILKLPEAAPPARAN
jgi:nucleoid-associated protein YgaU